MLAPVLSLSLALVSFETTANLGIRGENQTGQRPLSVNGDERTVTEFVLVPTAGLNMRFKSSALNLSYSPRLFTRFPNVGSGRPLLLHQFGANYSHNLSPRVSFGVTFAGGVGEVDYSGINLVQGTGQVVPGTGEEGGEVPATSAAGSVPEGEETFSNQNYAGSLNLSWQMAKNHNLSFSAGGSYNAPLGSNQVFPEQLGGTAGVGWSWRMHPNYTLGLNATYGEARVSRDAPQDPNDPNAPRDRLTGVFRSTDLSLSFGARASRVFNFGLSGGLLFALNEPALAGGEENQVNSGFSAIPTGNLTLTFIPTSGRGNYHLSTSFGLGVSGFVDPLQAAGYTARLALSWNLFLSFFDDWSFTPAVTFFTPATLEPAGQPGTGPSSLNETLMSVDLPLSYQITGELNVSAGARIATRGSHLFDDTPGADPFRDHFVLGFLAFTASTNTKL